MAAAVGDLAQKANIEIAVKKPYDHSLRESGLDWPSRAESMIGLRRMTNIQDCIAQIVADDVPGDLIETGVWRGGACIFMKANLRAWGDTSRNVWLADSFEGLPKPNAALYPADEGDTLHKQTGLAVGADQVRHNFERYGLLDDRVRFLVGWFKDTLPTAPVEQLSLMRLDGDMYESTIQAIEPLYPKLSPGGFCIIDDFGSHASQAGQAVHDYRDAHGITDEIVHDRRVRRLLAQVRLSLSGRLSCGTVTRSRSAPGPDHGGNPGRPRTSGRPRRPSAPGGPRA